MPHGFNVIKRPTVLYGYSVPKFIVSQPSVSSGGRVGVLGHPGLIGAAGGPAPRQRAGDAPSGGGNGGEVPPPLCPKDWNVPSTPLVVRLQIKKGATYSESVWVLNVRVVDKDCGGWVGGEIFPPRLVWTRFRCRQTGPKAHSGWGRFSQIDKKRPNESPVEVPSFRQQKGAQRANRPKKSNGKT